MRPRRIEDILGDPSSRDGEAMTNTIFANPKLAGDLGPIRADKADNVGHI
jgi:hypothetical protein